MTPEDRALYLERLAAELAADPAGRGYAEASDAEAADLLNAPYATQAETDDGQAGYADVHLLHSLLWKLGVGGQPGGAPVAYALQDVAATAGHPLRLPAAFLLDWVRSGHPYLDLDLPEVQAGFGGLAQAGILTGGQLATVNALRRGPQAVVTQHPPRIVAVVQGLPGAPNAATAGDVEEARNGQ